MENFPTLQNAPIVESILDVQMVFPEPPELELLLELQHQIAAEYPTKEDERKIGFSFQQQPGKPLEPLSKDFGVTGFRFRSVDNTKIVQFKKSGFTFNRLEPYVHWNEMIESAVPLWKIFRAKFPDATITRIGVRNINLIKIPTQEANSLEEYLTVKLPGPKIEGLISTGFLSHGIFSDKNSEFFANWLLARQISTDPLFLPLALDIDVYAIGPTLKDADPVDIWNKMRHLKNTLFFSSLTDKGINRYK